MGSPEDGTEWSTPVTEIHCVKWRFRCAKQWEDLEEIRPDLRYCDTCERGVHRAATEAECDQLAASGKCVALIVEDARPKVGLPEAKYRRK